MIRFRSLLIIVAQIFVLSSRPGGAYIAPYTQPAAPRLLADGTETIVNSGTVSDFTRNNTTLYWHSVGRCVITPKLGRDIVTDGDVAEAVSRVSTIGTSPDRQLYAKDLRATNGCNQFGFSQIVADADYLYWVEATGLVKLSREANPGDEPQVLNAAFNDQKPYQIAIDRQYVYLSRDSYTVCGPLVCSTKPALMVRVDKSTGASARLNCTIFNGCAYGTKLKLDPLGRYLYYIEPAGGQNNLQRMDLSNFGNVQTLTSGVSAYLPEGWVRPCPLDDCPVTDYVFIAAKDGAQGAKILRYNTSDGSSISMYTSTWPGSAEISDIVTDKLTIFFYETREDLGPSPFLSFTSWLFRSDKNDVANPANIHQTGGSTTSPSSLGLDDDGAKLYWIEGGNLLRLSNQAQALPRSPMRVTGMEVTQGIQSIGNHVPLIRGKRTFVRLYVKSDDPTRDVPGVTASLSATWTGGNGGGAGAAILPVNLTAISVKRSPNRSQLNDAFLFELPWDWVSGDNLRLTAELNPKHNPEQSDNYVNNVMTVGPLHLNPAPRLEVRLFEYSYKMGDSVFGPEYYEKYGNIDWIRRAYPVDESEGNLQTAGGGLRWSWSTIRDDALADKVRYPSWPCEDKGTTPSSLQNPKLPDCQNLRASAYVASQIAGMRDELRPYGDTDATSYYGLISQGAERRGAPPMTATYFPRGQDGAKDAAGPAGAAFLGYYAAHEIGHSVGLGHPATAAATKECGVQGSDGTPNYPHGHIGADDDTTNAEGFLDTTSVNSPPYDNGNLALGSQNDDMMAYCLPQWISDQNYIRIYQNLNGMAPTRAARSVAQQSGDWLVIYGSIFPGSNTAAMDYVRHTTGSVTVPPRVPGPYAVRLLDGSGHTLQDYPFTPASDADDAAQSFGQAVAFVNNARAIRIVRLSDQHTVAETSISANLPQVRNVTLARATSPLTGTALLSWSGSDPDGDALRYDVLYSRDGGASFQPLMMHLASPNASINTTGLGGGTGLFRVIASDGVNIGSADSAPVTVANKAPMPRITLPGTNIHIHYGQVVNFSGTAVDAQDSVIDDSHLVWMFQSQTLGTGPLLTAQQLPPGMDVVRLLATNRAGLSGTARVTVTVDDDVEPPDTVLGVAPGAITWHINSDATAPQTRTLSVSNAGPGSAGWQVTSDAAWLSVSTASGSLGERLVVTGDPAGLHNGETRVGHLTFTTTSYGATQTVQVAVTLIKGNVFQNPYTGPMPGPQPPHGTLYLPMVRR